MTTLVRIVLTVALLFVVWHHAHWSVALSLTLMATSHELMAAMMRAAVKKELQRHEQDLG